MPDAAINDTHFPGEFALVGCSFDPWVQVMHTFHMTECTSCVAVILGT